MDKQVALIEAISTHGHTVRASGYELEDLANAAAVLGQERLAARLFAIRKHLTETFDLLNSAHGAAVHDNMVRAEEATHNLMRGVLAGISIGANPDALESPSHE